ncbi:YbaK/EbsC family protein [Candidatus Nitrotoga sp. M5]|uniref:YbaK/EbsC family protein n=1 Tax=Candidatus Nitrotoga sp. M5 TaxID=2890409 RepID=UPI001EF449C0|nr:YbaK/EbsC family protein [Candidatus Nitrotoga sp. M5]CAH1388102.1 Cys-tRNA(Pro)/Cys-tRNA(Cys) deacylase [Candidatus Nitrotoga sp. M5]
MTPAIEALVKAGKDHRVIEVGDYDGENRRESLAQSLGVTLDAIFKTLVAKLDRGELVTALVPINAELNLKSLAALAGAKKASMASTKEAEKISGYVIGGISPLGQRRRLATYADQSILSHPKVYVSAGRRGLELEVAPGDLLALCSGAQGVIAR